jgi:Cdc6-like AAA superfamily ATPase
MPTNPDQFALLDEAFSPSAPIQQTKFFFGRLDHLEQVVQAINERGQHIVVYGERGVGKTSFAGNVASKLSNVHPVKVTCNRTDGFRKLWDKAFQRVKFEQKTKGVGFQPIERTETVQLDLFLPDKVDITALDVQFVLETVSANLLFIFDEFDTVHNTGVVAEMADTIKALSDNAPRVSIMLVGVGATVMDIIGQHQSIERCLRQVKLPRMSSAELMDILTHGANHLGLCFRPEIANQIVTFSHGFPHFTHLLGKQACRAALEDSVSEVGLEQLKRSIASSVGRVDESVRSAYQRATMTSKDSSRFRAVVWACAACLEDEHGSFRGTDIAKAYSKIVDENTDTNSINYYIGKLCSEERGQLLEKLGTSKNIRYRFANPLLKAYVHLQREALGGRKSTGNL